MNLAEATSLIRALALPQSDYAVFGSGPLLVRGIIEDANDLDIISRGPAWIHAQQNGEVTHLPDHGVTVSNFFGGLVTVGVAWAYGNVDIDELIDSAEIIDGLPFVELDHVIAYKKTAARPKDLAHLRLIDDWLASGG